MTQSCRIKQRNDALVFDIIGVLYDSQHIFFGYHPWEFVLFYRSLNILEAVGHFQHNFVKKLDGVYGMVLRADGHPFIIDKVILVSSDMPFPGSVRASQCCLSKN